MIIRGLVHIDAAIFVQWRGSVQKAKQLARGAKNPPFAMKLRRMGHAAFVPALSSGCE
jgi:hypothetical protein